MLLTFISGGMKSVCSFDGRPVCSYFSAPFRLELLGISLSYVYLRYCLPDALLHHLSSFFTDSFESAEKRRR